MPDILQDLPIRAPIERVFEAVSTPDGLNQWWTETCAGTPAVGAEYALGFGADYQWRAVVTQCAAPTQFEFTLTYSDADWNGTRVSFALISSDGGTQLRFAHTGWPTANEHYRISSHCWAMYLRLLRRALEFGETVPYAIRLET